MNAVKKTYISIVVFSVISLLLIALVVYPLLGGIKENSTQLLEAKNKLLSSAVEEDLYLEAQELYKKRLPDLERMTQVFIDPDVPLELINFLEREATTSAVQIEITSIAKKADKKDLWPSLLVQISAQGPFPNFLRFLERLENGTYLIEVSDITVRKLADGPGTKVVVSIKVYTR
ncbi:MAG: hypothetical protein G01um101430_6 [Parcubacteria group bacterium Gr01-1014_30]|nr:MAG: hypothetical protein G01um101430_6 [Parcubacteria group bacterium Gr01-1014_30]